MGWSLIFNCKINYLLNQRTRVVADQASRNFRKILQQDNRAVKRNNPVVEVLRKNLVGIIVNICYFVVHDARD